MLVLPVEGEQPPTRAASGPPRWRRGPPTKALGPPTRRDPPSQHNLLGALRQPLGELGHLRLRRAVPRAGRRPPRPRPPPPRAERSAACALPTHQQVERVGKNRLPGPGLPGDRVQPLAEAQFGPLDQQQVLYPQLTQHAPCLAPRGDGLSPLSRRRAPALSSAGCTKSLERTRAKPMAAPTKESDGSDQDDLVEAADEGDIRGVSHFGCSRRGSHGGGGARAA